MVTVFYFGLFAMSFDFISGYTGYLSLGHAAFYGIGAYAVLMVANGLVPFVPADSWFVVTILLAGLVSVVFAVVIGAVSFRLRGFYFAMITLGFTQVMYVFMSRWRYPVGEGRDPSFGISANPDVPGFEIGVPFVDIVSLDMSGNMLAIGRIYGDSVSSLFGTGIEVSAVSVSYYLIGAVVLLCYFAMQRILHSPFGRVMVAIRENEERARAVGYNVFAYKLAAFSVSAFFAAVAGGLFAGYRRAVSPDETFFFMTSADAVLSTVIGGFGTLAGPLYGRTVQGVIENFLSEAPFVPSALEGHDVLILGVLFVGFVLYLPTGLVGAVRSRLGGKVADVVGDRIRNYFANL
jgi:branched-chain amino acid transport system permease protein